MLVLDLAENLLQHVFERDDARRAAEFVDHDGDVRAVLDEILQHQLQRHGLGNEIDLHHHVGDLPGPREEAFRIDVAHDVVDRFAPDEDARIFRVDEPRRELFDRGIVDVHGLDVHARNHAVPDAQVGEIQRVLKEFQFVVRLRMLLRVIRVEQCREVLAVETRSDVLLLDAAAQKAQDAVGQQRGEARHRIENDVEKVDHRRQCAVIEIGIVPENRLGKELGEEDDDDRRNGGIHGDRTAPGELLPPQRSVDAAQKHRHRQRIDDQRDVVAHEDRGDILSRMTGENLGNLVEHAVLLAVDLQLEAVLARKGNLHPREKSRQQQHYDDQDDGGKHRFQFLSLGSVETASSRGTGRASARESSSIFCGRRSTSASGLSACLSAVPAGISRAGAIAALPDSEA